MKRQGRDSIGAGSSGAGSSVAAQTFSAPVVWLKSCPIDLLLIIATPVLILPLVIGVKSYLSTGDVYVYVMAFGALGHHLPGMMRAYGDRALFRRFRVRFIVAPLFLMSVCLLFSESKLNGILVIVLLWGFWHGLMQVYGFLRIYDAKVGSCSPVTAQLDFLMCLAWFSAGMSYSSGRVSALLEAFYQSGGPLLSASRVYNLQTACALGTAAVTVAFLANLVWQWHRGQTPNAVKLLLMVTSFSFWWYTMVGINQVLLSIVLFEIFHDVQYLTIVWLYNRKRAENDPGVGAFTRFLFRRNRLMIFMYVGLVFAYGYIGLLAKLTDVETVKRLLLGFVAASTLLHFYFDGFIWKVRERSTREGLGLKGGMPENDSNRLVPGWLMHGLKWSLFVVPVCFLWYSELYSASPTLDRYRNITEVVPNSAKYHAKLGVILHNLGRQDEAAAELHKALQFEPNSAEAHYALGSVLEIQGKLDEAVVRYRRALEIRPNYAEVHERLGGVLRLQGKFDEAMKHFRRVSRNTTD